MPPRQITEPITMPTMAPVSILDLAFSSDMTVGDFVGSGVGVVDVVVWADTRREEEEEEDVPPLRIHSNNTAIGTHIRGGKDVRGKEE